jgi:hypothetical protein
MAGPWEKYRQGTQVKPADPRIPYQIQQEAGQAAAAPFAAPKAQADLARTQQEQAITAATAPAQIRKEQAAADKAELDLANQRKTGGASVEEAKAGGFFSRATKANEIYEKMGVGAPSFGREVAKSVLPDSWVNKFTPSQRQQAEAAERDFIMATLRYESGAAIPPEELESQRKTYFPIPGDTPETIALKAELRRNAIDSLNIGAGVAADRANAFQTATDRGQFFAEPQVEAATGPMVTEMDEQTATAVDRMVRMGRPYREISAFVQSKGYKAPDQQQIAAAGQYLAENPNYQGGFTQASKTRPTTIGEQIAGSPLGSYLGAAGTALTAGFNDELAGAVSGLGGGNYEQGRDAFNAKKALMADANPKADFAGSLAGNVLAMFGGGKLAQGAAAGGSRLGAGLSARGGLGLDAGYGAAFGAGQNNDNRLMGAGIGAAAGGLGNLAGQGLAKTAGGLLSPSGGELRPLYDMGVRPSLGQRIGGVANSAEEKLQSLPIVGDAIAGTRQRARDQFQVGLFNKSLGEINQKLPGGMAPGHDPHAFAQKAFGDAYDAAESSMTAAADPGFAADLGNLQRSVSSLRPESQKAFDKLWKDAVARRFAGGALTGPAFKDAMSELNKRVSAIRRNKTGDGELAEAIEQAMGTLRASASRNSPPEAVQFMDAVDRGYSQLVQIENASQLAGGEAATFNPSQFERAVKGGENSIRKRGYLAGKTQNSDIASLGLRLGDQVPNSASFDRLAWAGGVGALGSLEPHTFSILGALGAVNAPGVRNAVTGALAPRNSQSLQEAAERIRRLGPLLGATGAGTSLSLLPSR